MTGTVDRRIVETIENRRAMAVLGSMLSRLGLSDLRIDNDFDLFDAVSRADQKLAEVLNRGASAPVEVRDVVIDSHTSAHDHHVQFRILDTEDRVIESTPWVLASEASSAEQSIRAKVLDLQLVGEDVFFRRYHRCNHTNVTVQIDREDD